MHALPQLVSVGVNRVSGAAAWSLGPHNVPTGQEVPRPQCVACPADAVASRRGLIAYAAASSVAIYDPNNSLVVATLPGHTARVNAVAWLHAIDPSTHTYTSETELASCSVDGSVIVWRHVEADVWEAGATLTAGDPLTCLTAWQGADGTAMLVAASVKGDLHSWVRGAGGEWAADAPTHLGATHIMEALCLAPLPTSTHATASLASLMLVTGGVDQLLHVFTVQGDPGGRLVDALSVPGHLDWVRSVAVSHQGMDPAAPDHVFIASGSQDSKVRLWRVAPAPLDTPGASTEGVAPTGVDAVVAGLTAGGEDKPRGFTTGGLGYVVSLEAVLLGHEEWVNSVRWVPPTLSAGGAYTQAPAVITSSMDKSMAVWEPDTVSGLWMPTVRVGEVGGRTLGFFGGLMSPDHTLLVAHGYHGSLHAWRRVVTDAEAGATSLFAGDGVAWWAGAHVSGHDGPAVDAVWGPHTHYLVTCGTDRTARVFVPMVPGSAFPPSGVAHPDAGASAVTGSWHEISRPLIHGYELTCLAMPNTPGVPHRLIAGADEKTLRVFDAPTAFLGLVDAVCPALVPEDGGEDTVERVAQAYIPELQLSNKGFTDVSEPIVDRLFPEDTIGTMVATDGASARLPTEEDLIAHSVWPEANQLHGHTNEVFACAVDYRGTILATACKARDEAAAVTVLRDTTSWAITQRLEGHSLTVVQLEFSHNDAFLLTVSKDRQFCLYQREAGGPAFHHLATVKAHRRIIWSCSWCADDTLFATGSRDQSVKVWGVGTSADGSPTVSLLVTMPKLPAAVTAVAFGPAVRGGHLLAVGYESGGLEFWEVGADGGSLAAAKVGAVDDAARHAGAVRRIRWRPGPGLTVATVGNDHAVRVFDVVDTML